MHCIHNINLRKTTKMWPHVYARPLTNIDNPREHLTLK